MPPAVKKRGNTGANPAAASIKAYSIIGIWVFLIGWAAVYSLLEDITQ